VRVPCPAGSLPSAGAFVVSSQELRIQASQPYADGNQSGWQISALNLDDAQPHGLTVEAICLQGAQLSH
jgi:hypothetical protein